MNDLNTQNTQQQPAEGAAPAATPVATAVANGISTLPTEMVSFVDEMLNDSGKGAEEIDSDSMLIPTIYIVQSQSAVLQGTTDTNARAGTLYNSGTGEFYKSIRFVVCYFQRRYDAYANNDGSYRGSFKPVDVETNHIPEATVSRVKRDYMLQTSEGVSSLFDTRIFYVLYENPNDGSWNPALLRLSRTQVKAAKRLSTLIKTTEFRAPNGKIFNPATWAVVYTANVVTQSNERGHWFGWNFSRNQPVGTRDLYRKAQAYYEAVKQHEIQAAEPETEFEAGSFQAHENGEQQQQQYQQAQNPFQQFSNQSNTQNAPQGFYGNNNLNNNGFTTAQTFTAPQNNAFNSEKCPF